MNDLTQLHSLADGELDSQTAEELNKRLTQDKGLSAEYQGVLRLKAFIQVNAETYQSEEAWKASVARLVEIDRSRRVDAFMGRNAWALCSVIFCSIIVGGLLQRNNSTNVSGSEVAGMMSSFTAERVSNGATAEERKWVQGIFSSAEDSLRRIQVEHILEGTTPDGRVCRRFYLRDSEGQMVLDVISGIQNVNGMTVLGADDRYKTGQMGQATTISWIKDGAGVFLTAPRDAESLVEIAKKLCPAE